MVRRRKRSTTSSTTLLEADIPVAPVKTIPQVAEDPHLWEREMLVKMPDPVAGEMYLPGATIKMSKTPGRVGPVPDPRPAHRRGARRTSSATTARNSTNCGRRKIIA